MRIVLIGTSDFAVPALNQIHISSHNILGVVTRPDQPKGRGKKLSQPPVKIASTRLGYKVLQPYKINSNEFISDIEALAPDLLVVVAFGQILCERLLKIPRKGAINVHPSLIPKYRGAAPIQWAIMNGDMKTGVTTMLMDSSVDTGHVLLFETTNIGPCETSGRLHDRLSKIGAKLLVKTINKIQDGSLTPTPQNCERASIAPMLKKKDGEINWDCSASKIESFIRAMNPWPGAFTFYDSKRIKIISAGVIKLDFEETPGTILSSCSKTLRIATGKHAISIQIVQGASGKKMPIDAFLCGCRLITGSILGHHKNK